MSYGGNIIGFCIVSVSVLGGLMYLVEGQTSNSGKLHSTYVEFATQSHRSDGNFVDTGYDYCSSGGWDAFTHLLESVGSYEFYGRDDMWVGGCSSYYSGKKYGNDFARIACANPTRTVKSIDLEIAQDLLGRLSQEEAQQPQDEYLALDALNGVEMCMNSVINGTWPEDKQACETSVCRKMVDMNPLNSPVECIDLSLTMKNQFRDLEKIYGYVEYTGKMTMKPYERHIEGTNFSHIANMKFNVETLNMDYTHPEIKWYFTEHTDYISFKNGGNYKINTNNPGGDWAGYKAYLEAKKMNGGMTIMGALTPGQIADRKKMKSKNPYSSSATIMTKTEQQKASEIIAALREEGLIPQPKSPTDTKTIDDMAGFILPGREIINIQKQRIEDKQAFEALLHTLQNDLSEEEIIKNPIVKPSFKKRVVPEKRQEYYVVPPVKNSRSEVEKVEYVEKNQENTVVDSPKKKTKKPGSWASYFKKRK